MHYMSRLPTLVLIAHAVFRLERRQTDKHTSRQTRLIALFHAGGCTSGVGK